MPTTISKQQLDTDVSHFVGTGTGGRTLSLADGAVGTTKLGFKFREEAIPAGSFTLQSGNSIYTLAQTAVVDDYVIAYSRLTRNGLELPSRQTGSLTATEHWSLSGTTLTVYGDITGSGDTYEINYVIAVVPGGGSGGDGVPQTRTLTAGAGLTGGGDLSANRTFDVVAGDGSIVVNANDIVVGVISDTQHGSRSGGSLHSIATTSVAGFLSAADKTKLDSVATGSDVTGAASSTDNALARFDGTTGKLIQNSSATLDDSGNLSLSGQETIKAHSAFSGSESVKTTAGLQTTTATQGQLKTITLADNSTYWVTAKVVARDTSGSKRAVYIRSCMVYRQSAGGATLGGAGVQADFTDETTTAWDANLTVSGNDLRVSVTGEASTTVNWVGTIEYQAVGTNS